MATRNVERLLNVIMTIGSRSRIDRRRLFQVIPEYAGASSPSAAEKMFERDKTAIRDLGLPLRSDRDPWDENVVHYRLDTAAPGADLDLDDGEYTVLLAASRAWDDAAAGGAARRVRAKLLSQGLEADADLLRRTPRGSVESLPVLTPLLEAVTSGHRVTFSYRAASGERSDRTVEPWIVGVQHGHWYVVGHDCDRGAARVFKATRIESYPGIGGPATASRPEGLSLAAALDGVTPTDDTGRAVLEIAPYKALLLRDAAAATLDAQVVELPLQSRAATLRQIRAQSRWVSLQSPEPWREALRTSSEEIAAAHRSDVEPSIVQTAPLRDPARIRRPRTGADDLSRLISLASFVLRRGEVELAAAAEEFGITEEQLIADLQVLFLCGDLGTGWEDFIEAEWEDGLVRVRNAEPLRRPLRLSAAEATALLAGLAVLEPVAGEETALVASARQKLLGLLRLGDERDHPSDADETAGGDSAEAVAGEHLQAGGADAQDAAATVRGAGDLSRSEAVLDGVHRAIREHRGILIRYSPPDRAGTSVRRIHPSMVEIISGRSYVRAQCELAGGERQFRLDRIAEILPDGTAQHREEPNPRAPVDGSGAATTEETRSERFVEDAWVRLDGPAMWIAEAFSATERRDHPDGGTLALLPSPMRSALIDAVMEAAGAAEVLTPQTLRDLIVITAEHAAARHGGAEAIG